jgi:signal transduction histidine kinase
MLNTTLELDSIVRHATRAATELTKVEAAFILLPDESHENLILRGHHATFLENNERDPRFQLSMADSTAGIAFKTRQTHTDQNPTDLVEIIPGYRVEFVVYVPLISRRRVVGVLTVYNRPDHPPMSDSAQRTLEQLAMHVAVAIDNTRIYADSQQRGFELALVIDATEAVNSTLSMPRVLSLVGKNLLKALRVNWCEIITCNPEDGELDTMSIQREATWHDGQGRTISMKMMPRVQQAFGQKRVIVLDAEDEHTNAEELALLSGSRSVLLVPFFLYKGRTLFGMMKVAFDNINKAEQMEVENPSALERKAYEMAVAMSKHDSSRALHLAHQVMRDTDATDCALWLWDAEANLFGQQLNVSNMSWTRAPFPQRDLAQFPTLKSAASKFSVVNFGDHDARLPADIQSLLHDEHLKVLLVIPFDIQGDSTGLVMLADTVRESNFAQREISLAQALVLQAASSIKNAQLFEDLQSSLEELRRTQAKLVQSARLSAIGELAAAVAHQINNPLTTILGDTELMLADLPENDPNQESLEAVFRAGRRAHEVVRRLLGMAAQKSTEDLPELMDINLSIRNTLVLVEGTLFRARVDLRLDLGENMPKAYGIAGQLEDVWLNLILNSRDAVRQLETPTIGIRSRYDENRRMIVVTVWDNGPGLGDLDPAQLFDAFFTTKPVGEGTGLGLYICANVVERCGGTIKAKSSEQQGAAFTVSLPCKT